MDESSGEEPILSTAASSTVAAILENATRLEADDIANGIGWGLGLFAGIVLVVAVGYFVMVRRTASVDL